MVVGNEAQEQPRVKGGGGGGGEADEGEGSIGGRISRRKEENEGGERLSNEEAHEHAQGSSSPMTKVAATSGIRRRPCCTPVSWEPESVARTATAEGDRSVPMPKAPLRTLSHATRFSLGWIHAIRVLAT